MRRATCPFYFFLSITFNFNPHPPCGGRPPLLYNTTQLQAISIHTLHAEGDLKSMIRCQSRLEFQSTPSMRRATGASLIYQPKRYDFNPHPPCGGRLLLTCSWFSFSFISIHTLHAEGDKINKNAIKRKGYFNPHPPCGGRRAVIRGEYGNGEISIHTLHAEGDHRQSVRIFECGRFQSTPSMRRATRD